MAKRIIILDRIPMNGRLAFNYVLWAEVPTARQPFYANAGAKSVWAGASVQENADDKSGCETEKEPHAATVAVRGLNCTQKEG